MIFPILQYLGQREITRLTTNKLRLERRGEDNDFDTIQDLSAQIAKIQCELDQMNER